MTIPKLMAGICLSLLGGAAVWAQTPGSTALSYTP